MERHRSAGHAVRAARRRHHVDVAIVGAGFTGLWTAHYLAEADPSLRIAVLEAETVGFGASGRNGGWCSALFPASLDSLARLGDRAGRWRWTARCATRSTRSPGPPPPRASTPSWPRAGPSRWSATGPSSPAPAPRSTTPGAGASPTTELALLDADEARAVLDGTGTLAGLYTPDCAAIHPLRLARGLAGRGRPARRAGPRAHPRPPARPRPRRDHGRRRAGRHRAAGDRGLHPGARGRAADHGAGLLAGDRDRAAPPETWARIGLARRETFTDQRHLIIYGQRTADDRLVFGGRGAPYHFGSRVAPRFEDEQRVFAALRATLVDLLPVLHDVRITHAWGGPLGIPRDWCASVGLDRSTGLGWAGGYVGDGVTTTNLAGRTLRDLVLERDTALTRLPWVGHRSRRWEPEPLRWLGINAGLRAMTLADTEERLTGRPSLVARAVAPLVGG